MTPAPKRRWFQWSLRTMFVVVTVFGVWLGWTASQVRSRNDLIEYLHSLEHQQNPVTSWVIRCKPSKLPLAWKIMGARHDWATWLVSNAELTDDQLKRAKSLLPDCEIEVIPWHEKIRPPKALRQGPGPPPLK